DVARNLPGARIVAKIIQWPRDFLAKFVVDREREVHLHAVRIVERHYSTGNRIGCHRLDELNQVTFTSHHQTHRRIATAENQIKVAALDHRRNTRSNWNAVAI